MVNINMLISVVTLLVVLLATGAFAAPTKYTVDFTKATAGCTGTDCKDVTEAIAAAATGDLILVKHNAAAYIVDDQTVDAKNLQFIGENSGGGAKAALRMNLIGGAGNGKWVFSNFHITNGNAAPFIELQGTTGSPTIYFFDVDLDNVAASTDVVINTKGTTTTGSPTVIFGFGTIETHKVIEQNDDTGKVQTSIVNCQITGIDQKKSFLFEGEVSGTFTFKGNTLTANNADAPDDMYKTKTDAGETFHFFSENTFDFSGGPEIDHEIWEFETTGSANAFLSFYKNVMEMRIDFFAVKWQVDTSGLFYYVGEENTWDFNGVADADEVFPISNGAGTQVIYVKDSIFTGLGSADANKAQIEIQANNAAGYICMYLENVNFFQTAPVTRKGLEISSVNGVVELKTRSNAWGNNNNRINLNYATLNYISGEASVSAALRADNAVLNTTPSKIENALGNVAGTFDAKCNGGGADPVSTLPRYRMPKATDDTATYNGSPLSIDVDSNDVADPQSEALTVVEGSFFSSLGYVTAVSSGNIAYSDSASLASAGTSDTFYYVLTDATGGFDVSKVVVTITPPSLTFNIASGLKMYIPTRFTWTHNLNSGHKITVKLYETDKTTPVTGQTFVTNRDINPAEYTHAISKVLPKAYVLKAETSGSTGNKEWWSDNFFVSVCTTMTPTRAEHCYHI